MAHENSLFTSIRHPKYKDDSPYWDTWRECYEGGPRYVDKNLRRFSRRETEEDYQNRKFYTPIPGFASAAADDIRNSIFQRLRDVSRRDGSKSYMSASAGERGGVDNKGNSMQSFLGIDVLTELLVMGRAGVYVDMPVLSGLQTRADEGRARPYTYMYSVEDILSWTDNKPEEPGNFSAVLLRDRGTSYHQTNMHGISLPSGGFVRYRFIWVDPTDGLVKMKLYDEEDYTIDFNGTRIKDNDNAVTRLDLEQIPFAMLDIGGSVLKGVCKHQIALLNLGSSDVSYAFQANFPFYTEQSDNRDVGNHLKMGEVDDDGTTVTTDNSEPGIEARTGAKTGRRYGKGLDRPEFIHPSSEPLMASMKLQEKLEDGIRKLVNLAVQNKTGQRAAASEAKNLSDQGLEAGLSYIGLVLESAERAIAQHWAAYESRDPEQRQVATIKYPDRYSLKDDKDRIEEANSLAKLMYAVPGKEVKKELSKNIVSALLAGRVDTATIDKIYAQIDNAPYATSDPDIIMAAQTAGLVGEKVASSALGFSDGEHLVAREDHIARITRIAEAQSAAKATDDLNNPAARGVDDLDKGDGDGKEERKEANDPTLKDTPKDPTRGDGKRLQKAGDE